MKKGEIYEGVIEKIDFQNKGRVIRSVVFFRHAAAVCIRLCSTKSS